MLTFAVTTLKKFANYDLLPWKDDCDERKIFLKNFLRNAPPDQIKQQ